MSTYIGPEPRHPDQVTAFSSVVDTSFATPESPMTVRLSISLHRTARRKCSSCGNRRVCFYVGLGDLVTSPVMCADCSGIR